ncbi:hypothetical protein [Euzebya sp.]|uniref:hypothetical protein n=1 Tax=Euzebya sp. TaxID=1971409 RepID=UPI003519BD14
MTPSPTATAAAPVTPDVTRRSDTPRRRLARKVGPGEGTAELLPMVHPRCLGGGPGRRDGFYESGPPRPWPD